MRLACRVCLAVGIDDPVAWLENVEPQTLAIWRAFYRVEPWGSGMEQSAEQSSQLSMIIALLAAKVGANIKPQDIKEFMPVDWVAPYAPLVKKPEPKRVDPVEGSRLLCASVFPVLKKPDDWDDALQEKIALEKASK